MKCFSRVANLRFVSGSHDQNVWKDMSSKCILPTFQCKFEKYKRSVFWRSLAILLCAFQSNCIDRNRYDYNSNAKWWLHHSQVRKQRIDHILWYLNFLLIASIGRTLPITEIGCDWSRFGYDEAVLDGLQTKQSCRWNHNLKLCK